MFGLMCIAFGYLLSWMWGKYEMTMKIKYFSYAIIEAIIWEYYRHRGKDK